jgi:branched-chain amino acid transport system substrate-binding protein
MQSKMRRAVAAAAIAALAAFVVAGCGGDSSSSSSGGGGGSGGKGKTIGVSISAPLSGDSAETGTDMLHGGELAASYLNSNGGIAAGPMKGAKLTVTGGDDAMTVKGALAVASKFVQDSNQWFLTGYLDSGMSLAAGQLARRQNLAVISSFACSTKLEAYKNVAIQCPLLAGMAATAVNYAATALHAKKIAMITTTEAFAGDYLKGAADQAKKDGVTITTTQRFHLGSTTDFSALVENMKSSGADAVISFAYQADAGRILSTMRRTGFQVPFVDGLAEGWESAFYGAAGSAATQGDGAYGLYAGEKFPKPGSFLAKMSDEFKAKYGKAMPTAAAYVFDSVLSGASAIAAGASARDQVADHYKDVSGEGITGKLGYGPGNRVVGADMTVSKVTGPKPTDAKLAALYQVKGPATTRVGP